MIAINLIRSFCLFVLKIFVLKIFVLKIPGYRLRTNIKIVFKALLLSSPDSGNEP